MIINSITLKNFRSYENETTFSFSPSNNKNIILIGGENGAGKSTLFEAIKLCIYGPITYGYLGINHNYLAKIKSNINDNAYINEEIESYIGLSLSFKEGTQIHTYYLKRTWNYLNHKLHETFIVSLNNKILNEEDKLYFDKFLKSVIPPSLFDFFFFDGEELSDFFTGKNANTNLKDSILELFNYDTFETLKKHLLSNQRTQSKSNKKLVEIQNTYDDLSTTVKKLKAEINNLKLSIKNNTEYLQDIYIKKASTEDNFKNSGGLLDEEKVKLNSQITKLEFERLNLGSKIKDFCNDTLPFLLVSDLLTKTKEQIQREETLLTYKSIKEQLSTDIIEKSLSNHLKEDLSLEICDKIATDIINNMFDIKLLKKTKNILELSVEQKKIISNKIDEILSKKEILSNNIFNKFELIIQITNKIKKLKEKLNFSMSDELLNNYLESVNSINEEINEIKNKITFDEVTLNNKYEELNTKEYHLVRAKNEYTNLLQNINVSEITNELIIYINELLNELTKDKISLIENEFINIFSIIIRKENYINSISIDDNFNTTLYINKNYTSTEILNAINNLGFDGIINKYGEKFLTDLYKHYNINNNKGLLKKLQNDVLSSSYTLSTKININDFSNGEKQIYILCLIWSIIKISGVEIPFIIDTPYARIDETHRNALSTVYLPKISKQVIILSTNKEIDDKLYNVIKPYVCDEYLLTYNTKKRNTEIKKGYFEV